MATTLIRGENALIDVTLYQSDGTSALLLTDCSLIKFELLDKDRTVIYTWNKVLTVYDTGMAAVTTSKFRVQLTKDISKTLPIGTVSRRVTVETTDATFTVDGVQRDISEADLLTVSE